MMTNRIPALSTTLTTLAARTSAVRPDLIIPGWGTIYAVTDGDYVDGWRVETEGLSYALPESAASRRFPPNAPENWREVSLAFGSGRPDAVVVGVARGVIPPE